MRRACHSCLNWNGKNCSRRRGCPSSLLVSYPKVWTGYMEACEWKHSIAFIPDNRRLVCAAFTKNGQRWLCTVWSFYLRRLSPTPIKNTHSQKAAAWTVWQKHISRVRNTKGKNHLRSSDVYRRKTMIRLWESTGWTGSAIIRQLFMGLMASAPIPAF